MEKYIYEYQKRKLYSYLGDDLVDTFKANNVIIAGGCINSIFNNKDINDIDTYFRSNDELINVICEIYDNYWVLSNTNKALLFKNDKEKMIQLIHFRKFNNAEEIFNTFDFTVCMGAFDFKTEKFILDDNFLLDNTQKVLHFNSNTAYPLMSMLRVEKYKNKGYNISKSEFIRILLTCVNFKINTLDDLKEQIGGMYGLDFNKVLKDIETNEDGTIDLEQVINKFKDLYLEDDYFKGIDKDSKIDFESVDDLIESALHIPIKYITVNNNDYKVCFYGKLDDLEKNNNVKYEKVDPKEYFKDRYFYKVVKEQDGKLLSRYDDSFEYKLNEEIIADRGNHQIYCNYKDSIDSNSYYNIDNEEQRVLELKVDYNDLVEVNDGTITFKKVIPVRIVNKEEYLKWIE